MNLLELMLKEEVEWPVGAEFAVQACHGYVFWCKYRPLLDGDSWECDEFIPSDDRLTVEDDDWSTRIISREEYQTAGGWMKIDFDSPAPAFQIVIGKGGECYRATNKKPVQLDNPEMELDFEPLVSVMDARECKDEHAITPSKYTKQIRGVGVDVYDVLMAWSVTNPALQHLIKKALQCGQRGHKDKQQDLQDIIDSAIRAKELEK